MSNTGGVSGLWAINHQSLTLGLELWACASSFLTGSSLTIVMTPVYSPWGWQGLQEATWCSAFPATGTQNAHPTPSAGSVPRIRYSSWVMMLLSSETVRDCCSALSMGPSDSCSSDDSVILCSPGLSLSHAKWRMDIRFAQMELLLLCWA